MTENDTETSLRAPILAAVFEHAGDMLGEIATILRDSGRAGLREDDADCGQDAPSVARFTWTAAFASDLKDGRDGREASVIRLDGRYVDGEPGLRVLRVTERRDSDQETLGGTRKLISLLLVDVDSGRARSLAAGPDMAFEVGVSVPDSLAEFAGGAA